MFPNTLLRAQAEEEIVQLIVVIVFYLLKKKKTELCKRGQERLGELQLHFYENETSVCVQQTVTQITQGQLGSTTTHAKTNSF